MAKVDEMTETVTKGQCPVCGSETVIKRNAVGLTENCYKCGWNTGIIFL